MDACEKLCTLLDKLRLNRIDLQHIDFGGGLGIQYSNEAVPSPTVLVAALRRVLVKRGYGDKEMIFEARPLFGRKQRSSVDDCTVHETGRAEKLLHS